MRGRMASSAEGVAGAAAGLAADPGGAAVGAESGAEAEGGGFASAGSLGLLYFLDHGELADCASGRRGQRSGRSTLGGGREAHPRLRSVPTPGAQGAAGRHEGPRAGPGWGSAARDGGALLAPQPVRTRPRGGRAVCAGAAALDEGGVGDEPFRSTVSRCDADGAIAPSARTTSASSRGTGIWLASHIRPSRSSGSPLQSGCWSPRGSCRRQRNRCRTRS